MDRSIVPRYQAVAIMTGTTDKNTTTDRPVFPPGRYGRRRDPRRRRVPLPLLLALLGALVGLVVTVRLYQRYGTVAHRPEVFAIEEFADDHVTFGFRVYKPPGEASTCQVRARARNGAEVGAADVAVPAGAPGTDSVTVRYRLATTGRPVSAEVIRCTRTGG
jgi:hypothetical protein